MSVRSRESQVSENDIEIGQLEMKIRLIELKKTRGKLFSSDDESVVFHKPVPKDAFDRSIHIQKWLDDESMPACSLMANNVDKTFSINSVPRETFDREPMVSTFKYEEPKLNATRHAVAELGQLSSGSPWPIPTK
jgi:hypothetical protein